MDIGDGDTTTRKVAVVEHGTGSGGRRVFSRGKKVAMEGENSQQGCEFASWAWTVFMPASSDHLLVLFLIFAPLHGNPCHLDFLLLDRENFERRIFSDLDVPSNLLSRYR